MGNPEVLKCQNCQMPLELDSSLMDLSLAQRNLLVSSATQPLAPSIEIPQARLKRLNSVKKASDLKFQPSVLNNLESYVFLNGESSTLHTSRLDGDSGDEDEDDLTSKTLSSRINTLTNIFNILSSKSNIEYPVCQDCCDLLIHKLKSDYEDALKERDTYFEFLKRLNKQRELEQNENAHKNEAFEDERKAAEREDEELLQNLRKLEDTEAELDAQIEKLEQELKLKKEQEAENLARRNSQELEKLEFSKELQSLRNQYEFTMNSIDRLRKTNIFNETFRISHDGPFGTINGLRLGGLDEVPVPWQETNAALGQLILLLATMCSRVHFKPAGYILRPMGSYSRIEQFDPTTQEWHSCEAFSNGGFKLGKFFHKETSFDRAMVSILDVIGQITSHLSLERPADSEEIELPYTMHGDKINGMAIRLCGNKPGPEWTTACKFLLTNAKWLLAFSSVCSDEFHQPK
ncbi:LAME_0F04698g1_1 [Lachancea meyersii CBS 8951]|uniref:LAME_0F04698g1_1 n=1 Tax=Lachancea meyersii CBS 8951 TaxID=1266667 RepID=A0A1G4JSL7_9SACH|nr:LAME_0F04698g1_1 [Lachancea meyersii CBS 8951]